jgi:hypothetical protein
MRTKLEEAINNNNSRNYNNYRDKTVGIRMSINITGISVQI